MPNSAGKRNVRLLLAAALVLVTSTGCSTETANRSAPSGGPARFATVRLEAIGATGVKGTARFTKAGNDRVRVILEVDPSSGRRAADIHRRPCAENSSVKDDLPDVVNGRSETVIPGSVQGLVGGGRSVAVHSTSDVSSPHAACGDIRRR